MLHAGLDLSRKKIDVCLLSEEGEHLDQLAVPPDADSLRTLARRIAEVHDEPVMAVIESFGGAPLWTPICSPTWMGQRGTCDA